MLKSEDMSNCSFFSVKGKTSRTQGNGICLGRLTNCRVFITTLCMTPLSPHWAWHLYHHTGHGTFITTLGTAASSPHWAWHLYHHTEHDSSITTLTMAPYITTLGMAPLSPH